MPANETPVDEQLSCPDFDKAIMAKLKPIKVRVTAGTCQAVAPRGEYSHISSPPLGPSSFSCATVTHQRCSRIIVISAAPSAALARGPSGPLRSECSVRLAGVGVGGSVAGLRYPLPVAGGSGNLVDGTFAAALGAVGGASFPPAERKRRVNMLRQLFQKGP